MERGAMEKLKFDKRLARRRDWVGEADLTSYVDTLPDVADKRWQEDRDGEQSEDTPDAAAGTTATETSPGGATSASESTPTSSGGF